MKRISIKIKKTVSVLSEYRNIILQFLLSAVFIGLGIWFFHHEETEIMKVKEGLANANGIFVFTGVLITIVYIITHGFMYRAAFESLGEKITVKYLRDNHESSPSK